MRISVMNLPIASPLFRWFVNVIIASVGPWSASGVGGQPTWVMNESFDTEPAWEGFRNPIWTTCATRDVSLELRAQ